MSVVKKAVKSAGVAVPPQPIIIPRAQHSISRSQISANALKVLYRLHNAGYSAYLVGGSVRDLLTGITPKDFDIATDARPEQVKELFNNCVLIGRRFRLAHIRFGQEIVEVATFRSRLDENAEHVRHNQHGMIVRDNTYGTLAEDAQRRDFTINALYYNIADFSIVDYCGGMTDLQNRLLRMIGEPAIRYREDPVRLLRAIRLAGKLDFKIAPATQTSINTLAPLLQHVSPARLFDEVLKLFYSGNAARIIKMAINFHLLEHLFPALGASLTAETDYPVMKLIKLICSNTDQRLKEEKSVSPIFLFASLLWYPLQIFTQQLIADGHSLAEARNTAARKILNQQLKHIAIPRRLTISIRDIWELQYRLMHRQKRHIKRIFAHLRFRAAYDFLLLRAQAGEPIKEIATWWTEYIAADETVQAQLVQTLPTTLKKKRRKKANV